MKAQTSQVFVYALTAVAVGLVLLLGYKFIGKTIIQGCEVQEIEFRKSLEQNLGAISHGSYKPTSMKQPCSYTELCFIDAESIPGLNTDKAGIDASISAGLPTTVFLVKGEEVEPVLEDARISAGDDGYFCIPSSAGRFAFSLRGQGQKIVVSAS